MRRPKTAIANTLRLALIYGGLLAVGAFVLSVAALQNATRLLPTELYILAVAVVFAALGIWAGRLLTPNRPARGFVRNDAALSALGITNREFEVLRQLADGLSNKDIARRLGVSPNTVKTQLASLFAKLRAARRTEALRKARELDILP